MVQRLMPPVPRWGAGVINVSRIPMKDFAQ